MITNPRGKQSFHEDGQSNNSNTNEGNIITTTSYNNKAAATTSTTATSRQWSGLRNPRIVRVSRTFGGKDRHSKVSTVRGLRDRRIRLSVPTAIQLYDLQDRLGLSQPSKVIDWLLEATEDDIENLPPLQLLPHHGLLNTTSCTNLQQQQMLSPFGNVVVPNFFDVDGNNKGKSSSTIRESYDQAAAFAHHQKLFPMMPSSIPGLLNNTMAYSNYFHHYNALEPPPLPPPPSSNLSLNSLLPSAALPQMDHHHHHMSSMPMAVAAASSSAAGGGSSQLFFCPSSSSTPAVPSIFGAYAPHFAPAVVENSSNHMIQLLSSSSSSSSSAASTSTATHNFAPINALMPYSLAGGGSSSLRGASFSTTLLVNPNKDIGSSSQPNKDHAAGS